MKERWCPFLPSPYKMLKWIQTTVKLAEWDIIGAENAGDLKIGCHFVLAILVNCLVQMGALLHRLQPVPGARDNAS